MSLSNLIYSVKKSENRNQKYKLLIAIPILISIKKITIYRSMTIIYLLMMAMIGIYVTLLPSDKQSFSCQKIVKIFQPTFYLGSYYSCFQDAQSTRCHWGTFQRCIRFPARFARDVMLTTSTVVTVQTDKSTMDYR